MGSNTTTPKQVSLEILPFIRIFTDGTFLRLTGTEVVPPGLDPSTSVLSKDIHIPLPDPASVLSKDIHIPLPDPASTLSARVYIPSSALLASPPQKLPVILYFHGGAFIACSIAYPNYHNSLNAIVSHSNTIAISLDYRLCPEHPLPVAYDDSWDFLSWILSQSKPETPNCDPWLERHADLANIFLAGDSCGANMAHHLALRVSQSLPGFSFQGMIMIHPYFWGEQPIGREQEDHSARQLVDSWWRFVCPSDKGNDDPLINPFIYGKCPEGMAAMPVARVAVIVAGEDILKDRGRLYYEMLTEKSEWKGKAEIFETEGADHVFHIFDHECDKAKDMFQWLSRFIHEN